MIKMKGPILLILAVLLYTAYLTDSFYTVWKYEKSCLELGGEFHFRKGNKQECLDPLTKVPLDDTSPNK